MEDFIIEKFGEKIGYDNSAQLCLRLFCTLDFIPEQYHSHCTKEGLATLFSLLSKRGVVVSPKDKESDFYNASHYKIENEKHWLAVIGSVFTNELIVKEVSRAYIDLRLTIANV